MKNKYIKEFRELNWKNVYTHHKILNDYRDASTNYSKKNGFIEKGQWIFLDTGELVKFIEKLNTDKFKYEDIHGDIDQTFFTNIKRPAMKEEVENYFQNNL